MAIATTEMVRYSAGNCRKILAAAARMITSTPANSHLPIPEKSRLETVATVAITPKIAAVPPKAVITSDAPLEKPSTWPIKRDSITPMKKVKPSKTTTPRPEVLVFSIAYMKPKAIARKAMNPIIGLPANSDSLSCTPSQAPRMVGIIDRASSQ